MKYASHFTGQAVGSGQYATMERECKKDGNIHAVKREFRMSNPDAMLQEIRAHAAAENVRVTQHAQQEMVAENISLDDVLRAIDASLVLEDYSDHQRGSCCLLCGWVQNRPLHVVCTTAQPVLIIITVYEPKPPKWVTPTQRRQKT
ncbi:MAG: DUF4258 domain-containing protein [Pseudomonadota bacterium]